MSILTEVLALVTGKPATIDGFNVTAADIAGLKNFPWADLTSALGDKLSSLDGDALVLEDILTVAGDFGLPEAALAVLAIKLVVLAIDDGTQDKPGGLPPIAPGHRGSDPFLS